VKLALDHETPGYDPLITVLGIRRGEGDLLVRRPRRPYDHRSLFLPAPVGLAIHNFSR